jgi:hypothetical protein
LDPYPYPPGGLKAAIVAVARRRKEYHVVADVEGHELKTPETEHHPGLDRLLETTHLELDGKLFVNTQQAPTWRANCPGPTSELSPRAPAQMGRCEVDHEWGKEQAEGETQGLRVALRQVGCACSRGLQAFAWERARALCVGPFSRAANLLVREPCTFLL